MATYKHPRRFCPVSYAQVTPIVQPDAVPDLATIVDRVSRGLGTGLSSGGAAVFDDTDDEDMNLMDRLEREDYRRATAQKYADLERQEKSSSTIQSPDNQAVTNNQAPKSDIEKNGAQIAETTPPDGIPKS